MPSLRVNVISDVHGRVDGLAGAGDGADALICLGDLISFVDYLDHSRGVMGSVYGAEAVGTYVAMRSAGRYDESRAYLRDLSDALPGDPAELKRQAVRRQYADVFGALPDPTYITYGNVDLPALWPEYIRPGTHVLDGQALTVGGVRFGFVGGGLRTRYGTPYEQSEDDYAAKLAAVGSVDVLCCHIPPDVPDLLYDEVGKRFERGSAAILDVIATAGPRYVLFGHVHQPRCSRVTIRDTECINVGHFRATGQPLRLTL
ncbi:MAG: metallophosphoesterase family protein [Mycobacteriales bacterium]